MRNIFLNERFSSNTIAPPRPTRLGQPYFSNAWKKILWKNQFSILWPNYENILRNGDIFCVFVEKSLISCDTLCMPTHELIHSLYAYICGILLFIVWVFQWTFFWAKSLISLLFCFGSSESQFSKQYVRCVWTQLFSTE